MLEVDRLVKVMTRYRKQGQFQGVWTGFNDSVNLMASRDVAISPLWPSAAARIAAEGIRVGYASPPEGYRGSCSAIADATTPITGTAMVPIAATDAGSRASAANQLT